MRQELEEAAAEVEKLTRLSREAERGSEEHRDLMARLTRARKRLWESSSESLRSAEKATPRIMHHPLRAYPSSSAASPRRKLYKCRIAGIRGRMATRISRTKRLCSAITLPSQIWASPASATSTQSSGLLGN